MTVKIPKSQRKWMSLPHYSLQYDGNVKHLNMLYQKRFSPNCKHEINSEFLFLDQVRLGLAKTEVLKLLGAPFFMYEDFFKGSDHAVFTYGLKSGSNKIKAELHFLENKFRLGTIYYLMDILDLHQINESIQNKYKIKDFDLHRECITDIENNTLNLQIEQSHLIINLYK